MADLSEQATHRIIGAYGEPFLRYVFALPEDKPVLEALQSTRAEYVVLLQTAIDQTPYSGNGDVDFTFTASSSFAYYRKELGGSLANYLHRMAGGDAKKIPSGKDPVVQAIREVAHDVWPSLLLTPPKHGPRAFWMSTTAGIFSHPKAVEACKTFMADSELKALFPNTPSIEEATSINEVILQIQANWILSSGQGGSKQLISIIDAIIFNAAVHAQLDGSPLNERGLMSAIPSSVEAFRTLATMKPVEVPAIIGFSGLRIEDDTVLKFGDDELRGVRPVEKNLLLNEADRVSSVFTTNFPIQLLKVSAFNPSEPDDFIKVWNKYSARIQESHRTLQRRIDRARLSILLASTDEELLATSEVSRYIADPTQPGGLSNWQMDPRTPASYALKAGQDKEVLRFHALIQEKHPESLDIAMKRILGAVSQRWDATDAFIDAVVVWENAFGTSTETTFRVTGSIAKLLEPGSSDERAKLQKELKNLYETRSRLVHGAKEPKPEEAWTQRERAIQIALEVLRKLYVERPDLLELSSELRSAQLLLEG
ncbi:HEPN domain-containing protein [Cryobacterium lyxosi]|uniref:Uncharacterized protein n=1 Tax=Cryobacterium lyxosi TaxID=1259228 RepID=A0A4V3INJ8_9MICO|nr:HEPN domain-containing protein [Cryobacterium lyxosi]TFD23475.1 hypothetical protein E3T27_14900 [Cryobacterium lyxosi]